MIRFCAPIPFASNWGEPFRMERFPKWSGPMTTRTWIGANSAYGNAAAWQPNGVPGNGDTLIVQSGTVNLRHATLAGVKVELTGLAAAPPTLALTNVTIAASTTIEAGNFVYDANNYNYSGVIDASGTDASYGTLGAVSTDFERAARLTVNIGGRFTNAGTITSNAMGFVTIDATTAGAALVNTGLIDIYGHATIDAATTGVGTVRLEAAAPVHSFIAAPVLAMAAVGSGQTIAFLGGDDLQLTDLADFHGAVSGFSPLTALGQQDHIDLVGQTITSSAYAADATGGVLTLFAGTTKAGQIQFAGSYAGSDFRLTPGQIVSAAGTLVPDTQLTLA